MQELMNLALKTARRLWTDPEGESIAGEALLQALQSFDPTRGVPIKAYVVACVKLNILYHKRKAALRHDIIMPEAYWKEVYDFGGAGLAPHGLGTFTYTQAKRDNTPECRSQTYYIETEDTPLRRRYQTYEEEVDLPVSFEDWHLLHEHYIDKFPLDVIARKHNTTVYNIRKLLAAAKDRYIRSQE